MWWLPLIAQVAAAAPPDSVAALRVARSAQAAFERYRIAHLPRSRGGSRSSRCDEIVGRLCFWHGEDGGGGAGPAPPPRHAGRDYPGADSAFAAALHAMPEDLRCRWTDLSPVLGGLRGRYRKLPCAQRVTLERRIWWLADPLYLVPGNERRTEHFSRRMMNALQDRAQSAYGMRWGTDLEELLIRYGWPVGWEQEAPVSANPGRPSIVSHNPPTTWHFLPPARFVEAPNTIGPEDWDLDPDEPVTSYAPAYARVFHVLPHHRGGFRGDASVGVVPSSAGRGPRREHGSTGRIIDERLEGRMARE